METKTAVVEFLKDERNWISRTILVNALVSLGKHSGGRWPSMPAEIINDAIDSLVAEKVVIESPLGLRFKDNLIVMPAVATPKRKPGKKPTINDQGTLF